MLSKQLKNVWIFCSLKFGKYISRIIKVFLRNQDYLILEKKNNKHEMLWDTVLINVYWEKRLYFVSILFF